LLRFFLFFATCIVISNVHNVTASGLNTVLLCVGVNLLAGGFSLHVSILQHCGF